MTIYYRATVPYKTSDGKDRFTPVGTLFQQREGSKAAFKLVLNFPIAVTELVFFPPKDRGEDPDNMIDD